MNQDNVFEGESGECIDQAIERVKKVAQKKRQPQILRFNDTNVTIRPNSDVSDIVTIYHLLRVK